MGTNYYRVPKVDEVNELKARLEALENQPPEPQPFSWEGLGLREEPDPNANNQTQPMTPEDVEQRMVEDLQSKPLQALWPMMGQAFNQFYQHARQQEAQVRSMNDFRNIESDYYGVPEQLIQQAAQNPNLIRYLLAKHRASVTGKPGPAPTKALDTSPPPETPTNGPTTPPQNMEELAEKFRKEGEERALKNIQSQRGAQGESTATIPPADTDEPELDEQGKRYLSQLGLSDAQIKGAAKRLDNYLKGE